MKVGDYKGEETSEELCGGLCFVLKLCSCLDGVNIFLGVKEHFPQNFSSNPFAAFGIDWHRELQEVAVM